MADPLVTSRRDAQHPATTRADAVDPADWARFARSLGVVVVALLSVSSGLITLANPYGNLPFSAFSRHVIVDGHQRFQYPALAHSGRFDSVLVGTSTSGILAPSSLNRAFGGHFANLAMDSARAWEQAQIATLFFDYATAPATLIVGIDTVWCEPDADTNRITERGFPDWMFDRNPWNDPLYMLNLNSLELSARRIMHAAGLQAARISDDGFKAFLPDDATYDADKAKAKIGTWTASDYLPVAVVNIPTGTPVFQFPAHKWLDQLLSKNWARAALVFMPVHVVATGTNGSALLARDTACKTQVSEIAKKHAVTVVDFRVPTALTLRDENFWDPLHYRLPVGEQIVNNIKQALVTGENDPGGTWQILAADPRGRKWR